MWTFPVKLIFQNDGTDFFSSFTDIPASSPGTAAHSVGHTCQEPVHILHIDVLLKWQLQLSHAGAL